MQMAGAKGFCVREKLNRFEPVSFSLPVIAVENIDSFAEIDLASEIAEAIDGD